MRIVAVLLAVLLAGCSPAPAAPSALPSTASSSSSPAGTTAPKPSIALPTRAPEPPGFSLVGWVAGRIAVVEEWFPPQASPDYRLLSVDPAAGAWREEAGFGDGMPDMAATDGRSVAYPRVDEIDLVTAGTVRSVTRPAGVPGDWDAYGLPALPGGGYLVTGVDRLLRIATDGGAMTSEPLPGGYVAVAPTSDPDRFFLAPVAQARVAYGLVGAPFDAYLWTAGTAEVRLVARGVTFLRPADAAVGLAFVGVLAAQVTTWSAVTPDGSLRRAGSTTGNAVLSADGSLFATTEQVGGTDEFRTVVGELATGTTVVDVAPRQSSGSAWNGDEVAVLLPRTAPLAGDAALVVVTDGRAAAVPMPSAVPAP